MTCHFIARFEMNVLSPETLRAACANAAEKTRRRASRKNSPPDGHSIGWRAKAAEIELKSASHEFYSPANAALDSGRGEAREGNLQ
jgi:hypothetical protein